ncbi:MAG: helix-turn-helix domain-containing protein [Kiritimatiellae bacterium]|nr:helix-turn-helix domain-containing protein [Kiritimatiellia bacterium]
MSSRDSPEGIAIGCGFPGLPALSRYFKRETGQTPSEWRRR